MNVNISRAALLAATICVSVVDTTFSEDRVYILKEVALLRDRAEDVDAPPRYSRLQYSIISNVNTTEERTTYDAKTLVRSNKNISVAALLAEVLDPDRPLLGTPASGSAGVVTASWEVNRTTGLKNVYPPSGKVAIDYTLPRIGFEEFCTPGLTLPEVRDVDATFGFASFATFEQFTPRLRGRWSYRKSRIGTNRLSIAGPFLATTPDNNVQISGHLKHVIDAKGAFAGSSGHYLAVVTSEEEIRTLQPWLDVANFSRPLMVQYRFELSTNLDQPVPRELAEHLRNVTSMN